MTDQKSSPERAALIRRAWRNWILAFVPLFALGVIGLSYFGMKAVLPVLLAVLTIALFYQRYVNKRSWHSIMWGVYATKE